MVAKKVTDAQIITALKNNAGIVAYAARDLNIARSSLRDRLKNHPHLAELAAEEVEITLDACDALFVKAIRTDKDLETAKWYAIQKGKHRGYGDKTDVNINLSDDVLDAIVTSFGGDADGLRAFRRSVATARPPHRAAAISED